MRTWVSAILFTAFAATVIPAHAASVTDLIFSLDSSTGSSSPTNLNADADPPCLQPNCVLFTGTLTDTDFDPGNADPMQLFDISISYPSFLSIDNTFFYDVPGTFSGDAGYATDQSGAGPTTYSGPIFGIDIAPGTPVGIYDGSVTITAFGGAQDPLGNGFTVTDDITVDVLAPEPAAADLLLVGLLPFAAWFGLRRKWHSSEASR